jgi:hypothetical protein
MKQSLIIVLLVSCVIVSITHAQTITTAADAALPRFEAASVKPADPNDRTSTYSTKPGQFHFHNVPLIEIVTYAFAVPDGRISNVPDWAARERFTVTARMPQGAPM